VTDEPLDDLLRLVMGAADTAFLDAQRVGGTGAECTRRAVEEAFRCAVGNGLVALVPSDRWPTWVVVSRPYRYGEPVTIIGSSEVFGVRSVPNTEHPEEP
jgi:hypothetical protein